MQGGDSAEISFTSQQLSDASYTAKIIRPTKDDKKSQSIILVEKDAPQGSTANAKFEVKALVTPPPGPAGSVTVGDYVWEDSNKDGIQDEDESGIPGVTVTLTGSEGEQVTDVYGNVVEAKKTDDSGKYLFENLPVLSQGQSYMGRRLTEEENIQDGLHRGRCDPVLVY